MPNCPTHESLHPGIELGCLCLPAHGCGYCAHPDPIITDLQSVGALRQFINERPPGSKLLTNGDIISWLGFSKKFPTRWVEFGKEEPAKLCGCDELPEDHHEHLGFNPM